MKSWRRFRPFVPVFAVAMVSIAVSLLVAYLAAASVSRAFVQDFSGRAHNQAIVLQSGINDYWDKLYAVRALFDSSSHPITRGEFEGYSNSLLSRHPAILNIAWIPRVTREDRPAHELAAAQDGLHDYRIRAFAPDRSLPASPERDEYFPKFYSTESRTSPVYGVDLNDGGSRERTIVHIRDGNVLSTSPPLMLYIGNGDRRGFWAALPVYARGLPHETVEDRRRNLRGFIQGVFQIGVMIDTILADVKTPVRLYLFAPDASADDLPVYFKSRLAGGLIEARSQAELAAEHHVSFPLKFGDVQWTMVAAPESAGLIPTGHERSLIVLVCGLLLSGGLTSFVWAMRRAHNKFEKQNLQFDAALNNMVQGLLMYDPAGKLIISNRRFAELMGVPWEKWDIAASGTTISQGMQLLADLTNVAIKNQTRIDADLQSILGQHGTGSIIIERTDGRIFSAACAPMPGGGFVVTFEDITQRRGVEKKISHMAHYDGLTDLPNRALFYEKMDELLARAPNNTTFAVLSLDLDRFKSVNDTLGHPAGDKLLQAVAGRMRGCIRESDIVARLGGDEFAIVQVTFLQPADAISLATRLIDAVRAPYQIDGHHVIVGTSVGIAIAPGDGMDPGQLIKNADLALYSAKAEGGNVYRFFETKTDALMPERRRAELRDLLSPLDVPAKAVA